MLEARWLRICRASIVSLALAALTWACEGGGSADGDDGDAGADTDTGTDSDDCEPVTWGEPSDFTEGQPVGNWTHTGYFDEDGDGFIEETEEVEASFSFEDIHCAGYESIVLLIGDTT